MSRAPSITFFDGGLEPAMVATKKAKMKGNGICAQQEGPLQPTEVGFMAKPDRNDDLGPVSQECFPESKMTFRGLRSASSDGGSEPENDSEEAETNCEGSIVREEATALAEELGFRSEHIENADSGDALHGAILKRDADVELAPEAPLSDVVAVNGDEGANGMSVSSVDLHLKSRKRKKAKDDNVNRENEGQPLQKGGAKKPKKEYVFPYGNYHRYYGYRLVRTVGDDPTQEEDPRLNIFQRQWFEGKDCLDVGCNEGFITISIAQKYNCQSILGVDIDNFLIEKATRNLQAASAAKALKGGLQPDERSLEKPMILRTCDNAGEVCEKSGESHTGAETGEERSCSGSKSGSESLLQKVRFRSEQFIEDFPHGDYMKDGTFDTVLCLSVTKWVHLNWGDVGLIRLFAKIFHILRPGGILVLEPQPWKSYGKKSYVSEVTRRCYETIRLRPTNFREVLLDKIGFRSVEEVSRRVPNCSLGFDRSISIYVK